MGHTCHTVCLQTYHYLKVSRHDRLISLFLKLDRHEGNEMKTVRHLLSEINLI